MTDASPAEPQEIEALLRLAQSGSDGSRVITALVRRIVEIQGETDEEDLLKMIAYVEALLLGEAH
jgi:hypothetical protein